MVILLSPAKTFSNVKRNAKSVPYFINEATFHMETLKKVPSDKLKKSMKLSDKLLLEVEGYLEQFNNAFYPAIYHYMGYQYQAFDIMSLSEDSLSYLQDHLIIVSGLYGLLKPFDAISSYRLEIKDKTFDDLYAFWKPKFHCYIETFHKHDLIIDLLSSEYRKAFDGIKRMKIDFYELKNNQLTSISMHVKKVRGLFARHMIIHHIQTITELKTIQVDGFIYHPDYSSDDHYFFIKEDIQ